MFIDHHHHIDREFLEGGFEIIIEFIVQDLKNGMDLDTIHNSHINITFGRNKEKITEEQFFLSYKSAQLVFEDQRKSQEVKKNNQIFWREPK